MVDERDELLEQPEDVGDESDDAEVDGEDRVDDQPTEEASDLATESLRELVRYLVHSLVDDPDTVEIFRRAARTFGADSVATSGRRNGPGYRSGRPDSQGNSNRAADRRV